MPEAVKKRRVSPNKGKLQWNSDQIQCAELMLEDKLNPSSAIEAGFTPYLTSKVLMHLKQGDYPPTRFVKTVEDPQEQEIPPEVPPDPEPEGAPVAIAVPPQAPLKEPKEKQERISRKTEDPRKATRYRFIKTDFISDQPQYIQQGMEAAVNELGWRPDLSVADFIDTVMYWYFKAHGINIGEYTIDGEGQTDEQDDGWSEEDGQLIGWFGRDGGEDEADDEEEED
jgi:hypothetical protein